MLSFDEVVSPVPAASHARMSEVIHTDASFGFSFLQVDASIDAT
jgi:hypothetical protein